MKKILIFILFSFIGSFQCSADDSKELELFGIKINYHNGSWVNPDEVKFEIKNPDSWIKRNYIRNYLQGSKELRGALIDFDWKAIWQASKSGKKIPLKELNYWNVELQKAYFSPLEVDKSFKKLKEK